MPIPGLHCHASGGKLCSHKTSHSHASPLQLPVGLNLVLSLSLAGRTQLTHSTPFLIPASTAVHLWKDLSSTVKCASSQGPYSCLHMASAIVFGTGPHHYMGVYNQLLLVDKHLQLVPASECTPLFLASTTACPNLYSLRTSIALETTVDPHSAS